MKKLLAFSIGLLSLCCWVSCSSQTPEEQAAQAALSYYQRLMEGYPDGLQAAKSDNDSLPADYREQRQRIFQQYTHDIEQKHGGLQAVSLSQNAARRDSFAGSDANRARSNYDKGTLPDNNALDADVGSIGQARSRHYNSTLPAGE